MIIHLKYYKNVTLLTEAGNCVGVPTGSVTYIDSRPSGQVLHYMLCGVSLPRFFVYQA